jgi:hypothetical protein
MTAVFAYVTAPSVEEADRIGAALVEEHLAACANIFPAMRSVYRWKGAIEKADEAVPGSRNCIPTRYPAWSPCPSPTGCPLSCAGSTTKPRPKPTNPA